MSEAYLAFDVRGSGFAVRLREVVEVLRMVAPTPLPGLPADVLGVVDYRGAVVPLLDPAPRLGLPPAARGLDAKIVVCVSPGGLLGIVVDELRGLVEAGEAEYRAREAMPIPAGAGATALVRGTVRTAGGLALALDLERLLSADERGVLEATRTAQEGA